jgi:hypothetical protein
LDRIFHVLGARRSALRSDASPELARHYPRKPVSHTPASSFQTVSAAASVFLSFRRLRTGHFQGGVARLSMPFEPRKLPAGADPSRDYVKVRQPSRAYLTDPGAQRKKDE